MEDGATIARDGEWRECPRILRTAINLKERPPPCAAAAVRAVMQFIAQELQQRDPEASEGLTTGVGGVV